MPVVRDFEFVLDVPAALGRRGFAAGGPERHPDLRGLRQALIEEAQSLLDPLYVYDVFPVEEEVETGLKIAGGRLLESKAAVSVFRGAGEVALLVYTIGEHLENRVREYKGAGEDVESLILDAIGSLAVSEVGRVAYDGIKGLAASRGLKASLPLNPGTTHWPMGGQRVFFELLPLAGAGLALIPPGFIHPQKSISMAIGLGEEVLTPDEVSSCDYCADPELCRRANPYGILV